MTLAIDTGRAVASHGARVDLVRALLAAPAGELETDYLEWKTGVELSVWAAPISRHILGFANREPQRAGRYFAGFAYFVLGAGPDGDLTGVTWADSADLSNWIDRYVGGHQGPCVKRLKLLEDCLQVGPSPGIDAGTLGPSLRVC